MVVVSKKKTTVAKKKSPKAEPKVPVVRYLIEDIAATLSTEEISTYCNQKGAEGWRLSHVGVVQGTSKVRLWFTQ